MTAIDFNASEYKPNDGFDLIEPGEYNAVIVASERKPTASGSGDYLKLEIQIADGKYQNRKLFDNLNLWNNNAQAREIARGQFSAICRAVNIITPNRSDEIHNKVLTIKVGVDKRKDTGEMQNRIKAYKPRGGASPLGASPSHQTQQAAGKPW